MPSTGRRTISRSSGAPGTSGARCSPTTTPAGTSTRSSGWPRATRAAPPPAPARLWRRRGSRRACGPRPRRCVSIAGARAVLAPGDGHLALVPLGAPAVVRAMVVAGNELQQLPYGPDGHPDPRGAPNEDCSSTINYSSSGPGCARSAEISPGQSAGPGLRPLGPAGARALDDDLRHRRPDPARLRDRGGSADRHVAQRNGCRAEQEPGRAPLADPRPHPHLGSLVGPPSAGALGASAIRSIYGLPVAASDGHSPGSRLRQWLIERSTTC